MNRQLHYHNMGRGGYVIYTDDKGEIKLDFEFGGGDCVAIIFVPSAKDWTAVTKRPLMDRTSILSFIAEQAIRDQAPDCHYVLSDNFIEILHR